jgi:hypothetical protein
MARTSLASSRRLLGAGVAGVALVVALAGCATPYTSNAPTSTAHVRSSAAPDVVLVCESGSTTTPGGVETSSATATRVPADTPIPAGCHLG